MLLIPAIDLRGGSCVRLYQGDFAQETRYDADPGAVAASYQALGATWLHVVDLDGAKDGVQGNRRVIERLASLSGLNLQVGGGIRDRQTIAALMDAGVKRVVLGSLAVDQSPLVLEWLEALSPEKICLALDVRVNDAGTPLVQTRGWTATSSKTLWDVMQAYAGSGLKHVLCTDVARDGTLTGPNLNLCRQTVQRYPDIAWQASGGIRSAEDLIALRASGVAAAISGKALLEQRITAEELRPFLPNASSPASTSATARS